MASNNQQFQNSPEDELKELSSFESNPLLYAHLVIKQTFQGPHNAFMTGNVTAGLYSMIFGARQLECICRAEGNLNVDWEKDDVYKKRLAEIEKKEPTGADKNTADLLKDANIANLKMELLLKKIFEKRSVDVEILA